MKPTNTKKQRSQDRAFLLRALLWFSLGCAFFEGVNWLFSIDPTATAWPMPLQKRIWYDLGMGLWAAGWCAGSEFLFSRDGTDGPSQSKFMFVYLIGWLLLIPMVVRRAVRLIRTREKMAPPWQG